MLSLFFRSIVQVHEIAGLISKAGASENELNQNLFERRPGRRSAAAITAGVTLATYFYMAIRAYSTSWLFWIVQHICLDCGRIDRRVRDDRK